MLLNSCDDIMQLREDLQKKVYVDKLTELEVNSFEDVIQLLSKVTPNTSFPRTVIRR